MNVLLLKMGGSGVRFGDKIPKQFHFVNDEPLFCYILREYLKINLIDKYIIVTNAEYTDFTKKWATYVLGDKLFEIVCGGDTSAKSSKNGILSAKKIMLDDDVILFHDATNPIVCNERIIDVIDAAKKYGFASLASEQVHAIYSKDANDYATSTIEKSSVSSGYSPEGYKFGLIFDCFCNASDDELEKATSAISIGQWHNMKVKLIVASFLNLKITYKNDFMVFKKLVGDKNEL